MMLRAARPDDAGAVGAIWNPIIRDTAITFWPTERSEAEIAAIIADRASTGLAFLLAEDAGRVIGFATYGQFRGGAGYAHSMEHTIHLAPEARGKGLGRILLAAIEDHARAAGHRLMIGGITGSNTGSLAFHAAAGYREWGRIPAAGWKFGQFHDLVLMGKDLVAAA
ncbi:GNAT family N-acetyltransferase [Paracoccus bogoriensis]|uniref:GNAT family N-acetyltransferase n=1 Tax=Paracoccus bogoriensis TaxID=242065 RepID=UPI001C682EFB|nr:GNAT family N-acetyltransferase [Paracoccus bogoriensis]MBW7055742.1 GNAT family N-acetyltransferase [Paracoccus bogoriensis]